MVGSITLAMAVSSALPPSNLTQTLFPQLLTASTSALRLDSRSPNDVLSTSIQYSPSQRGTSTLTLRSPYSLSSRTSVQCSIHAELVEPRQDRPYEGQVNVHLQAGLALSTSNASRSSGNAEAYVADLERQLDLALRRSGLIDREALCLKAGQLVWNVSIHSHLHAVEAGNALAACVLAASLSLADYRRRDATVEQGGRIKVYDEGERVTIPLPLTGTLVAIEVAVFLPAAAAPSSKTAPPAKDSMDTDDAQDATSTTTADSVSSPIMLVDPTPLEVQLSSALLTFVLTPNTGQFLVSEKVGREPVDADVMIRAMKLAEGRAKAIGKWQESQKVRRDEQMGKEVR